MAENRIPLCDLKDLPQGCGRGFSVKTCFGYEDIFVVHKQGRLFAYRNSCPHTGGPLDWVPDQFLNLDGDLIQCATHDALFRIEDGYWNHSDAAVVFQRVDESTGQVRYIYHGNDGTSFPWNDTAQLDYLKAEVREAVIGQILEVARRFSVIRFDAAMVLARRHIQRLWYPLPGHEAGIPSRSVAAVPADELRRLMPQEFWREVVDRVATEAPDTAAKPAVENTVATPMPPGNQPSQRFAASNSAFVSSG